MCAKCVCVVISPLFFIFPMTPRATAVYSAEMFSILILIKLIHFLISLYFTCLPILSFITLIVPVVGILEPVLTITLSIIRAYADSLYFSGYCESATARTPPFKIRLNTLIIFFASSLISIVYYVFAYFTDNVWVSYSGGTVVLLHVPVLFCSC